MEVQIKLMFVTGELPKSHPLHEENFNFKEQLVTLPGMMAVCSRCSGMGSHTNPSIDGNGLSREDMSDPDFMDRYMCGTYDVICEDCDGKNVVPVANSEEFSPNDWAIYNQNESFVESERQADWDSYYERQVGA